MPARATKLLGYLDGHGKLHSIGAKKSDMPLNKTKHASRGKGSCGLLTPIAFCRCQGRHLYSRMLLRSGRLKGTAITIRTKFSQLAHRHSFAEHLIDVLAQCTHKLALRHGYHLERCFSFCHVHRESDGRNECNNERSPASKDPPREEGPLAPGASLLPVVLSLTVLNTFKASSCDTRSSEGG